MLQKSSQRTDRWLVTSYNGNSTFQSTGAEMFGYRIIGDFAAN